MHVHTFSLTHQKYFFLSVIHGANSLVERRLLGNELIWVKTEMDNVPWLLFGDFNTELHMTERSDYFDGMHISQIFLEFKSCVEDLELYDLKYAEPFLTWSNKRAIGFLAKLLDIFFVNDYWMDRI